MWGGLKYNLCYYLDSSIGDLSGNFSALSPYIGAKIYMTQTKIKPLAILDLGWAIPLDEGYYGYGDYQWATNNGINLLLGAGIEYKYVSVTLNGGFYTLDLDRCSWGDGEFGKKILGTFLVKLGFNF